MLETVCTARKRVRIAGDDYPAELVKSKFMKLDGEHIRFVLDCMRENTTKIRNIKQCAARSPFPGLRFLPVQRAAPLCGLLSETGTGEEAHRAGTLKGGFFHGI